MSALAIILALWWFLAALNAFVGLLGESDPVVSAGRAVDLTAVVLTFLFLIGVVS